MKFYVGQEVEHITVGSGIIKHIDEDTITVKFDDGTYDFHRNGKAHNYHKRPSIYPKNTKFNITEPVKKVIKGYCIIYKTPTNYTISDDNLYETAQEAEKQIINNTKNYVAKTSFEFYE